MDIQLWRVEAFGGLELLRARLTHFAFSPHVHEEFMLVVTEKGNGSPRFWGQTHHISPRDVFVLSPGVVHSGGSSENSFWYYRSFYLPVTLMQRITQEITETDGGIPQFAEKVVSDPHTAKLILQAHMAFEKPISMLAGESRLLEALTCLISRYAKVSVHPFGVEHHAVKLVKDYLESFPGENVSLETLAREVGISSFRLCRVFRRETGLSPHAYQILVRLRAAKTLLLKGLPISQVALETGFFDQAHLTKHFKRIYGVTPGRYRR